MAKLSDKDYQILEYIKNQQMIKGFPPSVREICEAVGLKSTATIHAHLKKLEQSGKIIRDASKNRSIKLCEEVLESPSIQYADDKYIDVPVFGNVAAGNPILAVDEVTDTFALPMDFAKNKDLFMLRVKGESMINAAILDGDLVIVQKQETANNADIVVALIDDSATVKTFYKENGHYRLQPENDYMDPIIADDVEILGIVKGVFRMF